MNIRKTGGLLLFLFAFLGVRAEDVTESHEWLKIYYDVNGIEHIVSQPVAEIDSVFFSQDPKIDGSLDSSHPGGGHKVNVVSRNGGVQSAYIETIRAMVLSGNIPTVYIDTDTPVKEIPNKTDYLDADFKYVPYGDGTDSVKARVSIRGRGNTTWFLPKKPYRLKFDKKQEIGPLNKAKSFVLIANYLDNTLIRHVVAFKIADLLGMPYTNIPWPVNVELNGVQKGSYFISNKVGINSGSVDINEKKGILWEFDENYDEDFKFRDSTYLFPCMVSDPDFYEITEDDDEVNEMWEYWQADLERALKSTKTGDWAEEFDEEQLIKFLIVNGIAQNFELKFPKSLYLYKEKKEGKYKLGPVWDFDWAFGYTNKDVSGKLLYDGPFRGMVRNISNSDETFVPKIKEEFENFYNNHLEELMDFIDEYAALIRDSALADAWIWPAEKANDFETSPRNTFRFDENVAALKAWILERVEAMKESPTCAIL